MVARKKWGSVMSEATQLWDGWQALLSAFATVFTRPGWVRFVQWVTGMVLCWEEHTLTQILTALGLESRWRVLEHFAEYGAWDREAVERQTMRLIEQEWPARWGCYHPVAWDDTKLHRTSAKVWGTCTFHESSARSPNRAETVRAHNWVVMGDLVPGTPWTYLPHAARLYCRKKQLPAGERFQTKTALAVELLRQADDESAAPILGVCDGAYAVATVVDPCLHPQPGQRRIEILTRLRADARLYHTAVSKPRAKGRRPRWGPRLAAPQHHLYWPTSWEKNRAWIYGRVRCFQYKQLRCRWSVSGPDIPVHVLVAVVDGYEKPWFLVTSALDLSAAQVVAAFAARFRQEDGFRDHKQRLGMEECRAWTKEPVLRTFQVQMIALTLLRLLQNRLDHVWGTGSWWCKPAWNGRKRHASIRDLCRLFWRHRAIFSQLLVALEDMETIPQLPLADSKCTTRAA
jgi:DDE superfamily endonuclease